MWEYSHIICVARLETASPTTLSALHCTSSLLVPGGTRKETSSLDLPPSIKTFSSVVSASRTVPAWFSATSVMAGGGSAWTKLELDSVRRNIPPHQTDRRRSPFGWTEPAQVLRCSSLLGQLESKELLKTSCFLLILLTLYPEGSQLGVDRAWCHLVLCCAGELCSLVAHCRGESHAKRSPVILSHWLLCLLVVHQEGQLGDRVASLGSAEDLHLLSYIQGSVFMYMSIHKKTHHWGWRRD